MIVSLPWPHKSLSPNARVHWAVKARLAKNARQFTGWDAVAAGFEPTNAKALNVTITFTPPDNRPRDTDNMVGSVKPHLDGIADVLGVDDSKWSLTIRRSAPKRPGHVTIEVEEQPND